MEIVELEKKFIGKKHHFLPLLNQRLFLMLVLAAKNVLYVFTYIDQNEAGILFFPMVLVRSSETQYGRSSVFSKVRTVWSVGTDQRKPQQGDKINRNGYSTELKNTRKKDLSLSFD